MTVNCILPGNCVDTLKTLPDCSVDCCVTSPPYFHLRNYNDMPGQIGLEDTPDEYIENLTAVFREVYRVLKKQGTCWVVIGDSYSSSGKNTGNTKPINVMQRSNIKSHQVKTLPPKCLVGIPWRFAFAMMATGWIFRQDIIWHKPSPMPESVKDRFCKSHEYLFMFSKNTHYYFNLENALEPAKSAVRPWTKGYKTKTGRTGLTPQQHGGGARQYKDGNAVRLRRDVWTVPSVTSSEEHYAMFPEKLIAPCISCGCPENGIVLDPFMGSGTTAVASLKLFRNYIGCEINPDYIKIAERQIAAEKGLFNTLEAAG